MAPAVFLNGQSQEGSQRRLPTVADRKVDFYVRVAEVEGSRFDYNFDITIPIGLSNLRSFYVFNYYGAYKVVNNTSQADILKKVKLAFALQAHSVQEETSDTSGFKNTGVMAINPEGYAIALRHVPIGENINFQGQHKGLGYYCLKQVGPTSIILNFNGYISYAAPGTLNYVGLAVAYA